MLLRVRLKPTQKTAQLRHLRHMYLAERKPLSEAASEIAVANVAFCYVSTAP